MEYTEFSVDGTAEHRHDGEARSTCRRTSRRTGCRTSRWPNCDASTAKAKELGGKVMVRPQDIPNTGRFAIVSDPQGAMFAVFEFTEKK